jgi:ABC-2 type transport system permease protein
MATFVHLVNMPLLFTSTALVPDRDMPAWLARIASVNPLTAAVDACRSALLLGDYRGLGAALGFIALLAVALFLCGVMAMNRLRARG